MILLASTTDKLQLVSSGAFATDVHASWVDKSGDTITPGRTNTAVTTAATTDIVAAPAASTQRNIQFLSVRNKSASSQTVTVQQTDGTITVELFRVTLLTGSVLVYEDGRGFLVYDSSGQLLTVPGVHGATLHTGSVIPGANQDFGAFYHDVSQIAVPAAPGAGIRRFFSDSGRGGRASVIGSDGVPVSLEAGWEFLGSAILASAAANTATVVLRRVMKMIKIEFVVTGYGGSDIASLRVGSGSIDTGTNYYTRYITSVAGGVVMVNQALNTQAFLRLAGLAGTIGRRGCVLMTNVATQEKIASVQVMDGSGALATSPVLEIGGGGAWFNTTVQFDRVQMLTAGGATLLANSGFAVWGMDF